MNYKDKILYVLTFLSFSSVNFLNVSYSFVKRFIETDFEMTSTQIGVADGLKFFGTIVGLFFYINFDMIKKDKILLFYCLSIIFNGFSMGIIPLLSLFKQNGKWTVFLFNFLGGMTKAPSWPLLLQLVKQTIFKDKNTNKSYDQENREYFCSRQPVRCSQNSKEKNKNNKSFIIWTALTLLGNIFGLVIQQNLVYKLHLRWQFCLMVSVVCIFSFSIILGLFYYLVYDPQSGQQIQVNRGSLVAHSVKQKSLILKCLQLLFLTKNCLFTWSLVLILSIHSIMMMFLPLFLYKIGYHEYEGYILGWYNLCVVLGTLTFTCLDIERLLNLKFLIVPKNQPQFVNDEQIVHEIQGSLQHQNKDQKQCSFETVNLISLLLLVGTCIFLVFLPCPYKCSQITIMGEIRPQEMDNSYKLLEYFAVIGLLGFFLGGPLNKYESSEFIFVLKQFEHTTKQNQSNCHQGQSSDSDQLLLNNHTPKIFIGTVQILSYMTVMFFLILTGHIIETDILAFFYLIGILSAFIFILDIIKILECKLRNDY